MGRRIKLDPDPWAGKIGTPRRIEEHEIDGMFEWLEWASAQAALPIDQPTENRHDA